MLRDEAGERVAITHNISYWKASQEPLSADIGVVEGEKNLWIFDVGSSEEAASRIQALPGNKNVVISHFHQDHMGNYGRVAYRELYQGANTFRYTKAGEIVRGDLWLEDGFNIHLFELPSSHAKGCIGMEIDGKYAFLGDGTYCMMKQNRPAYNVNLLQEEISVLERLKARYFLVSHDEAFVRDREEILEELKWIYDMRESGNPYIFVD